MSRRDHTLIAVLLGVLAFGAVLLFSGVYIFSRYIARQVTVDIRDGAGGKSVDIETPVGSMQVRAGEVTPEQIGVPLYPGAQRGEKGATVSIDVPTDKNLRVLAAEFETPDAMEKVAAFYREGLPEDTVERKQGAAIEFTSSRDGMKKVVVVRRRGARTEIALASVSHGGVN